MDHAGDSMFQFRMRHSEFTQKLYMKQADEQTGDPENSTRPGIPIHSDGFTYGHVFFRQRKDSDLKRGYFQKSLVLLTPYNWPGLFTHILSILGPKVLDISIENQRNGISGVKGEDGVCLLQQACSEIAKWY